MIIDATKIVKNILGDKISKNFCKEQHVHQHKRVSKCCRAPIAKHENGDKSCAQCNKQIW